MQRRIKVSEVAMQQVDPTTLWQRMWTGQGGGGGGGKVLKKYPVWMWQKCGNDMSEGR